ncbi:putative disease resistance RPP13-like protein 1 [Vitis vinifera]|uniref:Putative disease resistance RPP13-like protein 1 n=1 Tax=Vitis vinifera TaxID=29760 RepID=A0A438CPZ7_VITVI|nr:putative disease resistance RPP13-like protein 1 [Vitis vinifera]
MHDLINDLAQSISGDICFNFDDELENNKQSTAVSEKARHLSFNRQRYEMMRKFEAFHKAKCLRTLVALPTHYIFYIFHFKLPDSVGHLYNLQTLILRNCYRLVELPMGIGGLINLQHVDISGAVQLQEMPPQMGNLTNLQTLSDFIVAEVADEEVEPFPFLRELTIRRCSKLCIHLPHCLPSLVKLDIFGCPNLKVPFSGFASLDCANLEKLPNGLRSLISLQELKLERCPKLVSFPEAALSPLLRSLVLQNCPSLICFPNGELPATTLKHLRVEDCENLESLPEEMMHHKSSSTVGKTLVP